MAQILPILIFCLILTAGFGAVYTYAKNIVPKKHPWIISVGWLVFIGLSAFFNPLLSFLPAIIYLLFCLFYYRKQNNKAIKQFFEDFGIYSTEVPPPTVLSVLSVCKWHCAEGKLYTKNNTNINFNWWQGHGITTSYSAGRRYTNIVNYLAISLPPGTATPAFKALVTSIADTSKATFWQKFKRFFVRSTYIPYLVTQTADGHYVIAWYINPTVKHYAEKIKWLMENA